MAKILMKGNEAIAEAALQAGCRFFFGYPITPQNQIPEYMSRRMPKVGGCFLQAESEVAAINMVYGAASTGKRVMTSSSSPGISLKQEGISYIAGAHLPCVIVNIMRAGPGLGGIQPGQADYHQATRGGGHGDYRMIVLAPKSVQEATELTMDAFDLADKYRMPAMILGDGMLGQMMEPVDMREYTPPADLPQKDWAATGWDGKSRERAIINSLYLDPQKLEENNDALQAKYGKISETEVRFETFMTDDCELLLVAYGTMARIAHNAVLKAREQGIKAGLFRPITLWPFPVKELEKAALESGAKRALVMELSAGQLVDDVRLYTKGKLPVDLYGRTGGMIPSVAEALEALKASYSSGGDTDGRRI